MVPRLTLALEELAAALKEVKQSEVWEVIAGEVEPALSAAASELAGFARGGDKAASSEKVGGSVEITGTTVAHHSDIRHYLVFKNPGSSKIGYICGPAATTWGKVERCLRGQKLSGSGARLRRVADLNEAQKLWAMSFPNQPMPWLDL